jgi:hypothetical protein
MQKGLSSSRCPALKNQCPYRKDQTSWIYTEPVTERNDNNTITGSFGCYSTNASVGEAGEEYEAEKYSGRAQPNRTLAIARP